MLATVDPVCLDGSVTDRSVPERCAAPGSRASVQRVGGTEAFREPELVRDFLREHAFPGDRSNSDSIGEN